MVFHQVSIIYHDATLGNAVNIVLVRLLKLEQDEVSQSKTGH
jgi:hypothetical protein